jgi:hypothetical protein
MPIAPQPPHVIVPDSRECVVLIYQGSLLQRVYGPFPNVADAEEFGQSATSDVNSKFVVFSLNTVEYSVRLTPEEPIVQNSTLAFTDPGNVDA